MTIVSKGMAVLWLAASAAVGASNFHFDTAKALYDAEQYQSALTYLDKSDTAGEQAPLRQLYRGMVLAQLQQWPAAKEVLQQVVQADPSHAGGWYWLGASQYYTKQYEAALVSINQAIELRPTDGDSYRMRGLVRFHRNEWNEGYQDWLKAVRLNPRDARTLYYLGRLFQEAGQVDQAKLWLTDAVRVQSNHVEALTYLGICEESLGSLARAEELYRKALAASEAANRPFSWTYASLSDLLRRTGRPEEARHVLEGGVRRAPEAHLLHALAKVLVANKESARAEQLLRDAIAKDPDLAEARYQLGRLLASRGKTEESRHQLKLFQQAKAAQKTRPQVKVLLR